MMNKTTQKQKIKNHLKKFKSITSWDAITKYRITRLAQYILLLKQEGMNIKSEWKSNEGSKWTEYTI